MNFELLSKSFLFSSQRHRMISCLNYHVFEITALLCQFRKELIIIIFIKQCREIHFTQNITKFVSIPQITITIKIKVRSGLRNLFYKIFVKNHAAISRTNSSIGGLIRCISCINSH